MGVGLDLGLMSHVSRARELRVGASVLFAGERRESGDIAPELDATRDLETLSVSLAWPGSEAQQSVIELSLPGHEGHAYGERSPVRSYRPTDIPFRRRILLCPIALSQRYPRLSLTSAPGQIGSSPTLFPTGWAREA
jgi:hypothetical protein